jgi:hypothetical protein
MDRQTTRHDPAWGAAALLWLQGRLTASARGAMLGTLALAQAVLLQPVLLVLAFVV